MRLILSSYEADRYMPNVFVLSLHEGKKPLKGTGGALDWRLEGAISHLIVSGQFQGKRREHILYYSTARGTKIFIFGAGGKGSDTPEEISARAELMMRILHKAGQTEFVLAPETMMLSASTGEELKISSLKFMEGILKANGKLQIDPHITIPCPGGHMASAREQIKAALDTLGHSKDVEIVEPTG